MSRRDYIDEILAKKQRSINEWDNGIHKLYALERSFDNIKSNDEIENAQLSLFLSVLNNLCK
jgi:hypothetical protein